MNIELFDKLSESNFIPFDIERLSKGELISPDIFDYLLTIDDEFQREKIQMQLEEQAKKQDCLSNFKKVQKLYNQKNGLTSNSKTIKYTVKHNEIADQLMKENSIVIYNDTLYIYANGLYVEGKKDIERKILSIYPEAKSNFREEVYKNLMLTYNTKSIDKECGIINFKNVLYDIKQNKAIAHTPNFFSVNQINVNFNKDAHRVKAIDDFFDRISTNNQIRKQTLLEMIGYCMTTSVNLQKCFILYGPTASNGKSTLIRLITNLVGLDNISYVSLNDMCQNRFASSSIRNKLLNIGAEMPDDYIKDVSNFKMLISGDNIEIEKKYEDRTPTSPYAKFIFNANSLPNVVDKTNGFYRRLHIIPLETKFTVEDSIKFNFNELITQEALEYLAKIALEAYLSMDKHFSNYEESDKIVRKYMISSNSVYSFITDEESMFSLFANNKQVPAQEVYDKYKIYCLNNILKPLGRNKFYIELQKSKIISVIESKHQKYCKYISETS